MDWIERKSVSKKTDFRQAGLNFLSNSLAFAFYLWQNTPLYGFWAYALNARSFQSAIGNKSIFAPT